MLAHFEKLRSDKLFKSAVMIQKHEKEILQKEVSRNQSFSYSVTRFNSWLYVQKTRQRRTRKSCSNFNQTSIRGYLARKQFAQTVLSVVTIQKSVRGLQARRNYLKLRELSSAVVIQKSWKAYQARSSYQTQRKSAVIIQSAFRRQYAIRELQQLKVEAKSLNKLKEVSYQLENKVIDLTQSLTAKIQDNKKLMEEIANLKALLEQQGQAHETLKTRELEFNEKFDSQNAEHQQEVENLNRELETIKSEYASAGAKIEQLYKEQAELKQKFKGTLKN